MVEYNLIINFLVAIALGALIGLEREFTQAKKRLKWYGGIRTFPLIALLGALAGFFGERYSIWITVVAFLGVTILIFISHRQIVRFGNVGITTEVAGLITFLVGALSYFGFLLLAVVLAVLMTLLLYEQYALHAFAKKIKKEELYSTIKFAIIAFVILPILPNQAYGPFGFFNPRTVWFIVVLVLGISFLGYILVKFIGERGIELTGFLGGFASSTATTIALIEKSKKMASNSFVIGIVAANSAMLIKISILVFILNTEIFSQIILPVILMTVMSAVFIAILFRKAKFRSVKIKFESPFTLRPAIRFAGLFVLILFVVKAVAQYFSHRGFYIATFVSGLVEATAAAVSALQLNLGPEVIGIGVVLAMVANTLSKGLLALMFGERAFAYRLSLILLVVAGVGGASLVLV